MDIGACDVFVNAAGGMRIEEPAVDLAVALAVASSFRNRAFPSDIAVFGEVGSVWRGARSGSSGGAYCRSEDDGVHPSGGSSVGC